MPHVITDNCIRCKYTDCVEVCPVVCFREAPEYLVIDPEQCIDCGMCVSECKANAIYAASDLSDNLQHFIAFNREQSARDLPFITVAKPALADADKWNGVSGKMAFITNKVDS